ncbi:methylcobamide:CoM methyltransferase MtaA [Methanohalobium sp.]|uniref:methylcobamide:CoM methyltransferase MtaA n=1 Tax=Methanohalobium sp. TaxID=2837493 RepID=UPI0025CD60BD|nr:methylcobamide:CoM methyltransferase MtaA [Methanohalobium sp.]
MNPRDRLVNCLKGKKVDFIPALSVTQTATVELMRMTDSEWPEAHSDPEKMVKLAVGGHEIAGLEAVRYPFCLTVLAEAMGCEVNMGAMDIQPSIVSNPYSNTSDIPQIPDDLEKRGRIPVMLEVAELIRYELDENVPIIAGLVGPATLTAHLMGTSNFLIGLIKKPEYVRQFLEASTDICIRHANNLLEHGADVVCVPDGTAGPDLIDPAMFESFIKPEYQRFCRNVKGFKVSHMCGDIDAVLEPLSECGFEGISVEEKIIDLQAAKEILGDKSKLIGNVSTSGTMLMRSYDDVKNEAKNCLEEGVDILAPGCGIAPNTPLKNIKALVDARDEYYQR